MDNSLMLTAIGGFCTIAGGFCGFLGSILVYRQQNKNQIKHSASILYYDLKSIENYLKTGCDFVNVRFFEEWQSTVAKCTFLKAGEVELLYKIYDLVYDYNYYYRLRENCKIIKKDDISQFGSLKQIVFDDLEDGQNMKKYSVEYRKIMKTLEKYQNEQSCLSYIKNLLLGKDV